MFLFYVHSGFPLSRYFCLRLSKHVFDADRNGHPLGENLNTCKIIPAWAGKFLWNFTSTIRCESEALIQKNNFLSAILGDNKFYLDNFINDIINIAYNNNVSKIFKGEKNADGQKWGC